MAASEIQFLDVPENVLEHTHTSLSLNSILSDIDLDSFEKATTKYRKPSYQRLFHQNSKWQSDLVESLLRGLTMGPIILSRWTEQYLNEYNESITVDFYNIEDGQSRLSALLNFKNGNITTKFGKYENVKFIFDTINIQIVKIEKANPRIRDSQYFTALCENFQLLQESSSLSASDRYWASVSFNGFKGSPLVDYTIELFNGDRYSKKFYDFMGLTILDNRTTGKGRDKLAIAVAFISAAWRGVEYANTKFYNHAPIMYNPISDEEKDSITNVLDFIFKILTNVETEFPRTKNEKFKVIFNNPSKFIGNIIHEYHHYNNSKETIEKWVKIINYVRRQANTLETSVQKILEEEIYNNLGAGHKRNCTLTDFNERLSAINDWYQHIGQHK